MEFGDSHEEGKKNLCEKGGRKICNRSASSSELFALVVAVCIAFEKRRQRALTRFPLVFCQTTSENDKIRSLMSAVTERNMRPPLVFGTRSSLNSAAAFLRRGPNCKARSREVMTMGRDGAKVAIDWELPEHLGEQMTRDGVKKMILGPIDTPVVLILHGVNTDASFGYIRSTMGECTNTGWIAAGMNFRGCGGIGIATPRIQNSAYTNDLRSVVDILSHRVAPGVPIFLVGFSLGANIVVKYLGEEGRAGRLPCCVAGAISFSNPLKITDQLKFPWKQVLAMGMKKSYLQHWHSLRKMKCPNFQLAFWRAMTSPTLAESSSHALPILLRNDTSYPHATKLGYENLTEYWTDASSIKFIGHVTVPLLLVAARDDSMVYQSTAESLHHCLANPNVIVMNTRSGGHLGFLHAPRNMSLSVNGESWANRAAGRFISSVLQIRSPKGSFGENEEDRKLAVENSQLAAGAIKSRL